MCRYPPLTGASRLLFSDSLLANEDLNGPECPPTQQPEIHIVLKKAFVATALLATALPLLAADQEIKEVVREAECIDERLPVIGEAEKVVLEPAGAVLAARVDSGATTASINAQNIELYEKDGKPWVRFSIPIGDGQTADYDLSVVRTASIKRHGAEPTERPVVKLLVRLGKSDQPRDFSLTDRSNFEFPVLLGRNFLNNAFLIDVSRKNLLRTKKLPAAKTGTKP